MKRPDPWSLVTIIGIPVSASFFHNSSQQQLLPAGLSAVGMTGREKLKCVYLFCTTYNWKSLTFYASICVKQSVVGDLNATFI